MNSLARSLCQYLCSRNNDISGYWGIGVLCLASKQKCRKQISFKIWSGEPINIDGYEISESKVITDKLVKHNLHSIEGRISFFENGEYRHGAEKYTCGVSIAVTQDGRTGLGICHVQCWPHDPSRESQRATAAAANISYIERLKELFK
jgi:hypothetical protein